MIYGHEVEERTKPNVMNTRWPLRSNTPQDQLLVDGYLIGRGLSPWLAKANGWYPTWNADRHGTAYLRIVIPAETSKPGHVYWQARAINPNAFIRYQSPEGRRGDAVVLMKPLGKQAIKIAVIVEGPMDALAAASAGYYGFAIMGNNPPEEVLRNVKRLCDKSELLAAMVIPDHDSEESGPYQAAYFSCVGLPTSVIHLSEWTPSKDLAGASVSERSNLLASRGAIRKGRP